MSLDALNLLLVLLAALVGGWAARRVGFPPILGELVIGIVLGPPLLGLLQPDDALSVIGKLGVVLLMLYIGLHLNPSVIGNAAKAGALAAAGGFIVPAALGFGIMMLWGEDVLAATFVAVAMGVTSLATKSRILIDLGILNTRIAHVLMAGALFSDVGALVIFSGVLGLAVTGSIALTGILATVAKAAAFIGSTWLVGTRVFPLIGRHLGDRRTDAATIFLLTILVGLGFAALADAAGLHAILGAFLAGLYIREGVLDRDTLANVERRVRTVSVDVLAPVFFVTAGFDVSFSVLFDEPGLVVAIILAATLGKIAGTAVFYLPTGHGFREGIAVGSGMNGRGAVEIIVAELALAAGIIDAATFSVLVFMAIFTTATVPILLTLSIGWLRRHGQLVADDRQGVIVVGAGSAALAIAETFAASSEVTVIDSNADNCRRAERAGLAVLHGSATDHRVMEKAAAATTRVLIAATSNAEVNVLAARIAVDRFGVPEVAAVMPESTSPTMLAMLDETGAGILFGRSIDLIAWDGGIDDGAAAVREDVVPDPVKLLDSDPGGNGPRTGEYIPIAVRRNGGDTVPFSQNTELRPGDIVVSLHPTSAAPDGLVAVVD